MKFILIPIIAWFVAQTIKFGVRFFSKNIADDLKQFIWTYVWASGAPSAHAAVLVSALYLVWLQFGFSAIFGFSLFVVLTFLYNLVVDRKRQEVFNLYFGQGLDKIFKKIIKDGILLDLAGHTLREIFWGILTGLIVAILLTRISW